MELAQRKQKILRAIVEGYISTGEPVGSKALTELLEKIAKALPPTRKRVKILLPFSMDGAGAELRKTGVVHSEEYTADGLLLDITAEIFVLEKYKDYII